jgi:hypothetical protein
MNRRLVCVLVFALPLAPSVFGIGAASAWGRPAKDDADAESTPEADRAPLPKAGGSATGRGEANDISPPTPAVVDFARLRAEYDRLRDELFRARARAALVEEGVYASKVGATLRWKGAPDFILHRAEIRLDGNAVWDSGEKALVDERIKVSERPIKPGTHTITVRLEVRPGKKGEKENADLGYESEHTFVVTVPDGKRTTVEITADDSGDLPGYEPRIEVGVGSEK